MADDTKPAAPVAPVAPVIQTKPAAPVAPVAPVIQTKPAAPVAPVAGRAKAAESAEAVEKLVLLVPHSELKHVITFGGHPRLYVKPGAPTAITPKDHETLKGDIGFQNLVKTGKFSVMA